jgi:hypothetical protein
LSGLKNKNKFFGKQGKYITFVIADEPDEEVELVAWRGICKQKENISSRIFSNFTYWLGLGLRLLGLWLLELWLLGLWLLSSGGGGVGATTSIAPLENITYTGHLK